MKPSLQLRFGQQLTMTPQLQQAIRLLQLSTLDLRQEIQDALDSNMMLETEEEAGNEVSLDDELRPDISSNDANNETEVNLETESMPDEMATDSQWEDIYDSLPTQTASTPSADDHAEFIAQQSADLSLHAHLSWQLEMCRERREGVLSYFGEGPKVTLSSYDAPPRLEAFIFR
jgi:RNA polymerase sigma-54 factor